MLTMFVSAPDDGYKIIYLPDWVENDPAHGNGWCVRTFRAGDELDEIEPPAGTRLPKPKPMKWEYLAEDSPSAIGSVVEANLATLYAYDEIADHKEVSRLGGWPTFIQGAWPWKPWCKEPGAPTFLFQICSYDDMRWGDAGSAFVGMHDDGRLVITWQCC